MNLSLAPSQSGKRLTWNRLVAIILVVMVIGIVLGAVITDRVGLFAPHLLPYTVPIYLLLWLPVFIIGLFFRPHGSRKALIVLIALDAVIELVGLALIDGASLRVFGQRLPACASADTARALRMQPRQLSERAHNLFP